MKNRFWIALALTALALSACGGGAQPGGSSAGAALAPVPAPYAGKVNPGGDVQEGARLYQENCAACHGEKADGQSEIAAAINPPPANLLELQKRADDDYLYWRIHEGKPGTAMAPWSHLDEEQIWSVVSYLRSLNP